MNIRAANRKTTRSLLSTGTRNSLKCSKGKSETFEHKRAKFYVACFCWENGLEFYTEAEFNSGGRADLVIADFKMAVETASAETTKEKIIPPLPKLQPKKKVGRPSPFEGRNNKFSILLTDDTYFKLKEHVFNLERNRIRTKTGAKPDMSFVIEEALKKYIK